MSNVRASIGVGAATAAIILAQCCFNRGNKIGSETPAVPTPEQSGDNDSLNTRFESDRSELEPQLKLSEVSIDPHTTNSSDTKAAQLEIQLPRVDFQAVLGSIYRLENDELKFFISADLRSEEHRTRYEELAQTLNLPTLTHWLPYLSNSTNLPKGVTLTPLTALYRASHLQLDLHAAPMLEGYKSNQSGTEHSTDKKIAIDYNKLSLFGPLLFNTLETHLQRFLEVLSEPNTARAEILSEKLIGVDIIGDHPRTAELAELRKTIDARHEVVDLVREALLGLLVFHSDDTYLCNIISSSLAAAVNSEQTRAPSERGLMLSIQSIDERNYAVILHRLMFMDGSKDSGVQAIALSTLKATCEQVLAEQVHGDSALTIRSYYPRDQFWTALYAEVIGIERGAKVSVLELLPPPKSEILGFDEWFNHRYPADPNNPEAQGIVRRQLKARRAAHIAKLNDPNNTDTLLPLPEEISYTTAQDALRAFLKD